MILTAEELEQLIKTVAENGEFNYNKHGLNIKASQKDNSLNIEIQYQEDDKLTEFTKFLERIDDDLFVEVCEKLGKDQINIIQKYLDSSDTIDLGIQLFKDTLYSVVMDKIEYLNNLIRE